MNAAVQHDGFALELDDVTRPANLLPRSQRHDLDIILVLVKHLGALALVGHESPPFNEKEQ